MTQIDHVGCTRYTPPKVQSMDYGVLCAHDEGFFLLPYSNPLMTSGLCRLLSVVLPLAPLFVPRASLRSIVTGSAGVSGAVGVGARTFTQA